MPGVSCLQLMGHMQSASCFLSKVLLENSPPHFLWIVNDCFQGTTTKLNSCETGLHGLEYSLDSPLYKKLPAAWPLLQMSLTSLQGRMEKEG